MSQQEEYKAFQAWHQMRAEPESELEDQGESILDQLHDQLFMDEEWIDRTERTIKWWGAPLPLRITVSPPRMALGDPTVKVTFDCRLLPSIGVSFEFAARAAAALSAMTVGQAYWVDPADHSVHSTFTHYAHPGNETILRINNILSLLTVVSYGSTMEELPELARLLGAIPQPEPHPESGLRPDSDALLEYQHFVKPHSTGPNPWEKHGFGSASEMYARNGIFSVPSESGLVAVFPLSAEIPLMWANALGFRPPGESIQYSQHTRNPHPKLGNGLLSLLMLPTRFELEEAALLANGLNWAEANELTGFSAWGAWATYDEGDGSHSLAHSFFSPAVAARPGLAQTIGFYAMLRSLWVQERMVAADLVDNVRSAWWPE